MAEVISYIGLGSNLDDPAQQLTCAIDALKSLPQSTLVSCSSFYRSKALTLTHGDTTPDYLNAVASIQTGLDPLDLLDALQAIEHSQGRVRSGQRWESRPLDLDILLYGNETIADKRLTVPHPEMFQRDFVLVPLAEIAADMNIAGKGSVASYLNNSQKTIVEKMPCAG